MNISGRWPLTFAAWLLVLLCGARPSEAAAHSSQIKAIYVFGDSYSDIGAGYVDGNGHTAIAYLAREIGLQMTYPGAVDATPASSLNFAVSGAMSDDHRGTMIKDHLIGVGLRTQAHQFASAVAAGRIQFAPQDAVAFLAIGLNDEKLSTSETEANIRSTIALLYQSGLRAFVIARLPTAFSGNPPVAKRLNPMLVRLPQSLGAAYPEARFTSSRWGGYFDEVYRKAPRFGFRSVRAPCAPGRALLGEDPTPCADPDRHFFYHPDHPATRVHSLVGKRLVAEAKCWTRSCGR